MRSSRLAGLATRSLVFCLLVPVLGRAQINFETAPGLCGPAVFAVGCGATGGLEGCSWNGVNGDGTPSVGAHVTSGGCSGTKCARIWAHGPFFSPIGGPSPEPGPGQTVLFFIPIPAGTTTVSFCWDFYNQEGGPQPSFNDGVSIDLVGSACGPSIGNLVYADTATPLSGGTDSSACGIGSPDVLGPGFQSFGPAPCGGAAFIRVSCWNGGDTNFTSSAKIDNICFNSCQPPCVLQFSAPSGPGSISVVNTPCASAAGRNYLTVATIGTGAYPNGWFFGVDIGLSTILDQLSSGPPFSGVLTSVGSSSFSLPAGIPSGLTVTSVTTHWTAGYGAFLGSRPAILFVTP
jgi:hypothetical protein